MSHSGNKIDLKYYDLRIEYDHMVTKLDELLKKGLKQEAEINDLKARIITYRQRINDIQDKIDKWEETIK